MTASDSSTDTKFDMATRSPADALDSLESAATASLIAAGIRDIGSYGWLNENDVDPDFIGHAMWQTDQPLVRALDDPLDERPVRERPSPRDTQILVAGEDLCGTMRLARLSIGLALLWRTHRAGDLLNDQPYFDLHQTDAILKLAIASDRLRDVLIVACTGNTVDAYQGLGKRNRWYVTPFEQTAQLLASRGIANRNAADAIAALAPLAPRIFAHIEQRNRIVHEIATRMGHITREQTEALEKRYDRDRGAVPGTFRPMPEIRDYKEAAAAYAADLDQAVATIVDWYKLLINASNFVFQIEYWSRVKP